MTLQLSPIVLFVYNRPNHTLQTLQALKNNILANESILYIFSDGNKDSSTDIEKLQVLETRKIIKQEKWCKEVIIIESEKNRGLAESIITGVTEIINKHGKIIVLEDDIVTSPFFLQYMNDALNYYENYNKVWHIAGHSHNFFRHINSDTFFTTFMGCWGWATWADRWKFFEKNPQKVLSKISWKENRKFTYNNRYKVIWQIKANIIGKRNTWAVFWYSTIYLNNGLCLNPKISFVKNIGMDGSGVHCGTSNILDTNLCDKYPIYFEKEIYETDFTRKIFENNLSTKNKKLILLRPNGQHSNRLIQNLHFEAFCKEYGIEYLNPTFKDSDFYISPCSTKTNFFIQFLQINFLGKLFHRSRIVRKIFSVAWLISKIKLIKYIDFDRFKIKNFKESEKMLLKAFEKNKTVYVSGFYFRVPELIEKFRDEFSTRYALKPLYYENNDFYKKVIELKKSENILIGVHIRRGDYKKWLKGKFYFEDNVYEKYIEIFKQKLSEKGKKIIVFILFSNEKTGFTENKNLLISNELWYIDQFIMSLCDILIGPHSSFSMWANYLGKNCLFFIRGFNENPEKPFIDFRHSSYNHDFSVTEIKRLCDAQNLVFL
ncbi:MAG: hypothetical protein FWH18_06960 [Marinilabiliaceae bacterium]|nr:hypothetical protein [Marinilabiliaceae bacterium]